MINEKNKENFFFAASNIKKYWSKDHPIIFSGDWCFDYKDDLIRFKSKVIPYQWSSSQKVIKAQVYCEKIFEEVLKKITNDLNKFHNQNHNTKYYRILLGNWLIHYIHQCYDKYICITEACKDKDIFTFYINEVEENIPYDFNEFITSSEKSEYQIRLFSELFDEMNLERRKGPRIKLEINNYKIIKYLSFYTLKNFISNITNNIFYVILLSFNYFNKTKIIVINPYFKFRSWRNKILLFIRSRGKIFFFKPVLKNNFSNTDIKYEFRNSKKEKPNTFNNIAYNLVKRNIPKVYLEYHQEYCKHVNQFYNFNDSISWLTFQWSSNTVFHYIAALKHNKSKIFLAQHGVGYGIDKIHSLEKIERSVSEKYFTYGWNEGTKTIPLAPPHIKLRSTIKRDKKIILFVSTTRQMHLVRFINGSNSSQNLIDNVEYPIIFFQNCKYKNQIYGRFHETDSDRWNNYQRIIKKFPNLKKNQDETFYESLNRVEMIISDHLGTTFLECLQANIPIIIFLNKKSYIFRETDNKLIQELVKNKIIFFNPKEAALFVNRKYENIDTWWNSNEIQSIRKKLLIKHFNSHKNWIEKWCEILL